MIIPFLELIGSKNVLVVDYLLWYNIYANKTKRCSLEMKNVQINISLPLLWKKELENLARIYSVEEEKTLTYLDLIRRAVKEKYRLEEE